MIEINDSTINEKDLANKNFPVVINGKEFWISRAVAVVVFIFKKIKNKLCVLTEIRGNGAADFIGYRCVPCGYVDYNETIQEAAIREVREETGMSLFKDNLTFMKINSSPLENRQNISIHFVYFANENDDFSIENAVGGEKDEISKVEWIPIGTIKKKNLLCKLYNNNTKGDLMINHNAIFFEKWAFKHGEMIYNHLSKFYNIK